MPALPKEGLRVIPWLLVAGEITRPVWFWFCVWFFNSLLYLQESTWGLENPWLRWRVGESRLKNDGGWSGITDSNTQN